MVQGIANKILRVNLSSGKISVDEPDESFYRTYLGGSGFVSYFLLTEVPQGIEALSPENKLIFALGPMTGLAMPGASRNCIGAKSPLTDGYAKSEVGGHWPMALKRAGYDAIIVEGKADKPVYLLVTDQRVEIRDAANLWGKTVLEAHDLIATETGIKNIRTGTVGLCTERLRGCRRARGLGGGDGFQELKSRCCLWPKEPRGGRCRQAPGADPVHEPELL